MAVTLFDLPWEDVLFSKVFPHLQWKDLFCLGSTSSQARDCMGQYFSSLKTLEFSKNSRRMNPEAFKRITEGTTKLKTVRLPHCYWLKDSYLIEVFRNNKGIEVVDLTEATGLDGTCLVSLFDNSRALKRLNLESCIWIRPDILEMIIKRAKILEEINLSSLSLVGKLGTSFIAKFLQNHSRLKKVRFAFLPDVNDSTLICIARNCKQLEHLDIRACIHVTDLGVRTINEYCHNIKTLEISHCHHVSLRELEKLKLRGVNIDRDVPVGAYKRLWARAIVRLQV